jgi:flagellar biosynthesis protein FliQ
MTGEVNQLFQEGMVLLSVVGAPMLGGLLVVGLVVGVLQSATQIQEPSVGAVPRIATIIALAVLLGPWMVEQLARFLAGAIERMGH